MYEGFQAFLEDERIDEAVRRAVAQTAAPAPEPTAIPTAPAGVEGTGLLRKLLRFGELVGEGVISWVPPEARKMYGAIHGIPPERLEEYAAPVEPQGVAEHVARFAGEVVPIGGAYKLAGAALRPVLSRAVTPLAKVGAEALRGATAGALYEGGRAALWGEPAGEVARTTAVAAPLWGLGDVALTGAMRYPLLALPAAGAGAAYGAWRAREEGQPAGPAALAGAAVAGGGAALLRRLAGAARATRAAGTAPQRDARDVLEEALAGVRVGEPPAPAAPAAPTARAAREMPKEIQDAAFEYARQLAASGLPEEQTRRVLVSELTHPDLGVHFQDAFDIATQAVNRLRLLEKARSEFEIKDAATELARMHLSRGATEEAARGALVAGLRQEFGKSEKEAAALADDVLARFKREAPAPTTAAAPATLTEAQRAALIARAEAVQRYWEGKTYKETPRGVTTGEGARTYTDINVRKAARKAKTAQAIAAALREGTATEEMVEALNKAWAARLRTKTGRREALRAMLAGGGFADEAEAVRWAYEEALKRLRSLGRAGAETPELPAGDLARTLADRLGTTPAMAREIIKAGIGRLAVAGKLREEGIRVGGVRKQEHGLGYFPEGSPEAKALGTSVGTITVEPRAPQAAQAPGTPQAPQAGEAGIVEFHAGIPLTGLLRLRRAGNTRDLFTPVTEISAARGSLPADLAELLPPDLRHVINELDRQIPGINQKMRELLVTHGARGPQELPPAAREEFEQLAQALENTRVERENWRPLIEEALGEVRQGRFSKGLLEKIESGKLVGDGDSMPITDPQGNVIGRFVLSPLEGKKVFIPEIPEATTFEEAVLSRAPGVYATALGAMRDVLTEPVVRVWRNANRLYEHFTTEYEKRLLDILKPVLGNKEARERIYYMLEGHPVTGATEAERVAAARLRKEIYDPLFKEFGIDPERYLRDYAPRIRQHGAAGLPADFTGPLKFFAELERTGELLPRETDALTTTLAYVRLGAKAKYFEPARKAAMPYVLKMHPDRRKIYEAFVTSVLRRPLWDERIINNSIAAAAKALGKEVNPSSREYSAFITNLAYLGTIGFNPMTVLKNLTQQVLAVASLTGNPATGLRYWYRAQRALRTQAGRKMLEYNWVAQDRTYLEGMERLTGFANRVLRPLNKAGFWAFEAVDRYNVNTSYVMKLLHALDQGKPLATAVESANSFAASTQFLYGLDSPLLYKSPVGRLLGMLTSYPVNFMRLLWEQGTRGQQAAAVSTLVSLAGAVYLLNKTGLDFSSEAPLGVAEGWLPVAFLLGGRSVSVPTQTVGALGETARRLAEGDPVLIDEAMRKLKENLALYLPGTVQRRRVEKFIDAARHDWQVLDEEGKLKYWMTPGEAARSLIGATRESRARWEEHKRISTAERWYRDTRRKAVEAYLRGDREALKRYQEALRGKGLRPVTRQDVRQYQEYQRQTAIERHRRGLPSTWTGE